MFRRKPHFITGCFHASPSNFAGFAPPPGCDALAEQGGNFAIDRAPSLAYPDSGRVAGKRASGGGLRNIALTLERVHDVP